MKYVPPVNGDTSDADRGWPNADPANGIEGAIPDGAAIEHPQREIIALIEGSGLTPDEEILTQLLQAVRSQAINAGVAGGTANALTATFTPSLVQRIGLPIVIKITATNTGAATLNGRAITRADGTALKAGDLVAGAMVRLVDDGTAWQVAGLLTSTLPTESVQIYDTAGTYTFTVPAGVYKLKRVRCRGAGGGGGGMGDLDIGGGGGGGGGGYGEGWYGVAPGQEITIVVGAAGTGGAAGGNNGTAGGTTSVGSLISCTGGAGGTGFTSGTGGGGAGGTVTGAKFGYAGEPGQNGINVGGAYLGGTGGGSPTGGGRTYNAAAVGAAGSPPGGGGGGGARNCAGGNGTAGLVILEY